MSEQRFSCGCILDGEHVRWSCGKAYILRGKYQMAHDRLTGARICGEMDDNLDKATKLQAKMDVARDT